MISIELQHNLCIGPGPARYSLPGTTGLVGHDKTKKVSPSYSFGLKTGSSQLYFILATETVNNSASKI